MKLMLKLNKFVIQLMTCLLVCLSCCVLTACSSNSSNMFNHTNDYKLSQERPTLMLPSSIHAQTLSDQYAIPDLNGPKKSVLAAVDTPNVESPSKAERVENALKHTLAQEQRSESLNDFSRRVELTQRFKEAEKTRKKKSLH